MKKSGAEEITDYKGLEIVRSTAEKICIQLPAYLQSLFTGLRTSSSKGVEKPGLRLSISVALSL